MGAGGGDLDPCVPRTSANGCGICTGGAGYVWSRPESTICPHPAGGNRLVKSQDLCPGHSDELLLMILTVSLVMASCLKITSRIRENFDPGVPRALVTQSKMQGVAGLLEARRQA